MMPRKLVAAAVMAALCPPVFAVHQSQQTAQATQGAQESMQQGKQSATQQQGSSNPGVVNAPMPNYTKSMERLLDASQRLREAIQAMAQQQTGPGRDRAISAAHNALFDAQQAMVALPPELRTGAGTDSSPNESRALDRLRQAADYFRESIQAMAQQPPGQGRNQAARSALEGLLETQMAMINLPSVTHPSSSQTTATSRSVDRSTQQSAAAKSGGGESASASDGYGVRRATSTLVVIEPVEQARDASKQTTAGRTNVQTARSDKASTSASGQTRRTETTFSALDRDGDGYVTLMEAAADPDATQRFKEWDRNRDYRLSRSEWERSTQRSDERSVQQSDQLSDTTASAGAGKWRAPGGGVVASPNVVRNPTTFEELDRDNDGYIGMMEAAADPDSTMRFKERDLNRDYKLSRSEWERTSEAERQREAEQQRTMGGDQAPNTGVAAVSETRSSETQSGETQRSEMQLSR